MWKCGLDFLGGSSSPMRLLTVMPVELRDLREDIDVGQALAPLPLGNGLIGVIELARKVQLGILMGFAVSGDIFCCGAPQRLFVLDHKDAPFP